MVVALVSVAAMVAAVPAPMNAQGVEAQKNDAAAKPLSTDAGWPNYGNDAGGNRFSPLSQVNRENVAQLKVAWTYHTGVLEQLGDLKGRATFEATPILVDGRLYLSTPLDQVIALEPETWEEDLGVRSENRQDVGFFGGDVAGSFGVERCGGKARAGVRLANFYRDD